MSVYVDPVMDHGWVLLGHHVKSCHLFADTDDELHEVAARIGMKRAWFQDPKSVMHLGHYDLTEKKRALALREGAKEVTREGLVAFLKRHRAAQNATVKTITERLNVVVSELL